MGRIQASHLASTKKRSPNTEIATHPLTCHVTTPYIIKRLTLRGLLTLPRAWAQLSTHRWHHVPGLPLSVPHSSIWPGSVTLSPWWPWSYELFLPLSAALRPSALGACSLLRTTCCMLLGVLQCLPNALAPSVPAFLSSLWICFQWDLQALGLCWTSLTLVAILLHAVLSKICFYLCTCVYTHTRVQCPCGTPCGMV